MVILWSFLGLQAVFAGRRVLWGCWKTQLRLDKRKLRYTISVPNNVRKRRRKGSWFSASTLFDQDALSKCCSFDMYASLSNCVVSFSFPVALHVFKLNNGVSSAPSEFASRQFGLIRANLRNLLTVFNFCLFGSCLQCAFGATLWSRNWVEIS